MNFLLDPNVAYFLLVVGFVLALLASVSPGTGIIEIAALFLLLLAGYGVVNLPINAWALPVLLLGVVAFVFSVRRAKSYLFLGVSLLAVLGGSLLLFKGEDSLIVVDPWLAIGMSIFSVLVLWFMGRKSLEAIQQPVRHDPDALIGEVGRARTNIYREGSVYIDGEEWSARSNEEIPVGALVRVTGREGLVLYVEVTRQAANTDL